MRQHTAVIALFLLGGAFVLGLLALASMLGQGSSQAEDATMHNCPQPSRWSVAVWGGDDGTNADQAFATCGEGAVIAAYDLDPQTQVWSRWFADQPDISTLDALDDMQGVLALGSLEAPAPPTPSPSPTPPITIFNVHFIDVGQGDATLIEAEDTTILVDGGDGSAEAQDYLEDYLEAWHIQDIDLMVATHPHADHIGGLIDVLALYDVHEIWTNGDTTGTQTYGDFTLAVAQEQAAGAILRELTRGYATEFDGLDIAVLHPPALTGDTNADSLVLRLTCGTVDILLTGDATADSEAGMVAETDLLTDVEVLKVGHHGSNTSTSDAFLTAVTPEDAVISVGAGNTYGHPHQETLDRLAAHGVAVYRTDEDGTVTLTSDCSTYSMATSGPAPAASPEPPAPIPTALTPTPTEAPIVNCDPAYPDVCLCANCGDWDCAGGSGNGPNYVSGPIRVLPPDPFDLDRDGDGWGCE